MAAIKNANIGVLIGGDASGLQRELKKADGSLNKFAKSPRKAINQLGKMGAAAAAAGAAIATALFKSTVDTAAEIDNLARVAGESVESFQLMAAGAKMYGVEQDKVSDILKDTNDKVGDFLSTGGGAMKDYFENIAPLVGQTADEFRNLSGREALQKYVNGLQRANLSQSEMTFYMEAIASDATLLLPLLKDNGKELESMAEKIDQFGGALSSVEVEQLKIVKKSMTESGIVMKNLINKIMVKFAPIVSAISEKLSELSGSTGGFGDVAEKTFKFVAMAAGKVANVFRGLHVVVKGLEVVFFGLKSAAIGSLSLIVDMVDDVRISTLETVNSLIQALNIIPKVNIDEIVVGQSVSRQAMQMWSDDTVADLIRVKAEMHNLAMQDMPADAIEAWFESVSLKSEQAAQKIVEARQKAAGPTLLETQAREESFNQFAADQQAKIEAAQAHAAELAEIDKKSLEDKKKADREYFRSSLMGFSGFFGDLSSLMESENKKQFKIGQAAAKAQAVIDGISAGIGAYKVGAGIGGPALGAAFAAASALATGQMMADLNNPGTTGGNSAPAAAPAAPAQESTFTVSGLNPTSLFSGEQVAEMLRDYQQNGGRLIIE